MESDQGKITIQLVQADITALDTDAIVNAANENLRHGGGVAGVIAKNGGPAIQQESTRWVKENGPVRTGSAAITGAGNLKTSFVIHAVGPVMGSGNEDEKLRSATLSAIQLAEQYNLKSIAFPAISTGIFGYPMDRCARIMIETAIDYSSRASSLERIAFCLYDKKAYNSFAEELQQQTE